MQNKKSSKLSGGSNENPYSNAATRDLRSGSSRSDVQSSGSRRAYAMFYGLEANDLTRSAYAKCKENLVSKPLILPRNIRSGAFRTENTKMQENLLKPNENKLRENRLATVGGKVLNPTGVDLNDPSFLRAKQKFFLLPSSHAAISTSKPLGQMDSLKQVSKDQNQHLNEIIGGNSQFDKDERMFYAGFTPKPGVLGSRHFENYKETTDNKNTRTIDSSASSFIAAKKCILWNCTKGTSKLRETRTPSTIDDELPINQKYNKSLFEIGKKTNLKSIKEEPSTFGKSKKLFTDSMMTPLDRVNGKLVYDILTCSFRKK